MGVMSRPDVLSLHSVAEANVRETTQPTALFKTPKHTPQLSADIARRLTQDAIDNGLFDPSSSPVSRRSTGQRLAAAGILLGVGGSLAGFVAGCTDHSGDFDFAQGSLDHSDPDNHFSVPEGLPLSSDQYKDVLTALHSYPPTLDNPHPTTGLLVTDPYDGSVHMITVDHDKGLSLLPTDGEHPEDALLLSKTVWEPVEGDHAFLIVASDLDSDPQERVSTPVVAVEDVDGKMILVAIPPDNENGEEAFWRSHNLISQVHPGDVFVDANGNPLAMVTDYETIGYHKGNEPLSSSVALSFVPLSASELTSDNLTIFGQSTGA